MPLKDKLLDFINLSLQKKKTSENIELGTVDEKLAKKIQTQTEIKLEGYTITIDSYGILHAMNRHSNEPNQNQISLSEQDFLKLEQIIFEADAIEEVSRYNKKALQFSKLIENKYFTIFEIITITGEKKKLYKKNRLAFKTMFIRKV